MTINPINMQVSVPRTNDMSQVQQQALHKSAIDQSELGQQALRETEQSRTKATKVDETDKSIIRDDKESSQHNQNEQKSKKKKDEQNQADAKSIHPYKGHSIDIKL